jgi:hypothetical protein
VKSACHLVVLQVVTIIQGITVREYDSSPAGCPILSQSYRERVG